MVQQESMLVAADNSGAKLMQVIQVKGSTHRRYAGIGDIIKVSIKSAAPRGGHPEVAECGARRARDSRHRQADSRDPGR